MTKKLRRYFITPTRLLKTPHFYKTVRMIKQVNEEQEIFMPPATKNWFILNWWKISVGNAILCIDNDGGTPTSYAVGQRPVEAKALYKEAIKTSNNQYFLRTVLSSNYISEDDINYFISERLEKRLEVSTREMDCILQNYETKLYQLEACWRIHPKLEVFGLRPVVEKVPNYILEELLNQAIKCDTYYGSIEAENVFRECLERGILQKGFATKIIKPSSKTFPHKKTASKT